ncbi:MAG: hydroxyisourate hydrolase [Boseongicola sp.]|nr:hydroxyisourate hydrolase [Boseongicola sp.]
MTAVVSSHALNAVDGSHAGGIAVRLINLDTGETLFDTSLDEEGRLVQEVADPEPTARYEMVLQTGDYWESRVAQTHGARIMDEVVVRFSMPHPTGRYHVPLILSPHGYSLWCSTEHG